jgi:hypothetical protein
VNYYLDSMGQPHEVWSDQSFSGSNLTSYLDVLYTQDAAGSATHHYPAEIKNVWEHSVSGSWQATTGVPAALVYPSPATARAFAGSAAMASQ